MTIRVHAGEHGMRTLKDLRRANRARLESLKIGIAELSNAHGKSSCRSARSGGFPVSEPSHRTRSARDRNYKEENAEFQELMRNDTWCAEKAWISQQQCPVNDRHCRTDATEVVRPLRNLRLKHRSLLKSHAEHDWPRSSSTGLQAYPIVWESSRLGANRTGDMKLP
jgi:hypothetical protein